MSASPSPSSATSEPRIEVRDLTMAYGNFVVLRDVSFRVRESEIFIIMGDSGSGKSTLLRHMIGLQVPAQGDVFYHGRSFWTADDAERERLSREMGVLFQSGALISSMTLAENVALPIETYSDLSADDLREIASLKLSLVGLAGFEDYYPSEISGGMRKRAGLARAMAMDPDLLFFDEPGAGLDPLTSRRMDDLIRQIRDSLGTTVVIVTHELASIFAIGDNALFVDSEERTMLDVGNPARLRDHSKHPKVRKFLRRGEE